MQNVFASATNGSAVALSDTVDQPEHKSIHANSDGDVMVVFYDNPTPVKYAVVTGLTLNIKAQYIMATGTTATDLSLMTW